MPQRPAAVRIVAILELIAGGLGVYGSLVILTLQQQARRTVLIGPEYLFGEWVAPLTVWAGVLVLTSLVAFFAGFAIWARKGWAYELGNTVAIINVLLAILYLQLYSFFINIGILYALHRPNVKAYLGVKAPSPLPSSFVAISEHDKKYMKQCHNCGAWIPLAAEVCGGCDAKQMK